MKKIIAAILLIATLVIALASCEGASSDDGIKSNGLLEDSAFSAGLYFTFNNMKLDNAGRQDFEEFVNQLAEGRKFADFTFIFKRAVVDKTITKVKFTIEADRDTTVCFATARAGVAGELQTPQKTVSLKASVAKEITFEPNYFVEMKYPSFSVCLYPDDKRNYRALSNEDYLEWNQTVYKITNIELYAE